jgi:UDP-2,4-diacetamido-2,4,6-trideoxy-beta-L-altropyranose hydrolase
MRCLALAQAWQDTGRHAILATAAGLGSLETRLRSEGVEVVHVSSHPGSPDDAIQTANLAKKKGAAWVVVDGYHFGAEYQRIVRESGSRLLLIDDNGYADHYYADIVLNQNIHAHEDSYSDKEQYTRLLLGTRYVLLRREFLKWRGWKREIPDVAHKVLVTLGGTDPDNVTLKILRLLQFVKVKDLNTVVVVGGENPHHEEFQSIVQDSRFPVRLYSNVSNMPELMAWADIAIAAGGTTLWELAFMGLPSLILVLADNQRSSAQLLSKMGAVANLGCHKDLSSAEIAQAATRLIVTPRIRSEMTRRGQELVDGEGSARVLLNLEARKLRLRRACAADCTLLWEWANDPTVRTFSFSSDLIPWNEHVEWFMCRLRDPSCFVFIAIDDHDIPIGEVRLDMHNSGEAEIHVTIDRRKRGLGYGSVLINLAVERIFLTTPIKTIHAFIKQNNERSIRTFEKAKFRRLGIQTVKGNLAVHYVREKP